MKEPSENSGYGQLRLVINCKTKMHTLSSHVITSIREEGARTSCTLNWKLLIDDVTRSKFETNLDIYLRGPDFYRSACGFCNLSGLFFFWDFLCPFTRISRGVMNMEYGPMLMSIPQRLTVN